MKQITILVLLLFTLVCAASTLLAQSGRGRTVGTNRTSSTSPDPAKTDSSGEEGTEDQPVAQGGETVENDVIRVDTALVTIQASVMDRNGRYIPNLGRKDFHIFEDGVEQRIAYFATVDQPFTVALVIDTSRSTHFRLEDIQEAAITFVGQLRPEDRVMVISFDDRLNVLAEPTNDRDRLTKTIRRTHTGGRHTPLRRRRSRHQQVPETHRRAKGHSPLH
jgi:Mg-chelatase subunit ChlD